MTEAFKREKVFRDPVHDYIHVQHPIILELINSREMQRLRRIKQTGASMYTFHTAEHSRFSHSLGVYEIRPSYLRSTLLVTMQQKKKVMDYGTTAIALLYSVLPSCMTLGTDHTHILSRNL